jgi:hypothetical protein
MFISREKPEEGARWVAKMEGSETEQEIKGQWSYTDEVAL